jgi:hypothetical protein
MRHSIFLLIGVAALIIGCTSTDDNNKPTGPTPEIALSVEAQPATIPANGVSRMVVFVEMMQGDEPVADSTQVILLNTIGTLGKGVVYTYNGVALDTLASDTIAGSGWLIAYANGRRDSVEIMFTESP